jgi:hypothetical protein
VVVVVNVSGNKTVTVHAGAEHGAGTSTFTMTASITLTFTSTITLTFTSTITRRYVH